MFSRSTCEMKSICMFIYCGTFNEREGVDSILRILMWLLYSFCMSALTHVWRESLSKSGELS